MDYGRQSLRMGAAVVALAITLRLISGGFFTPLVGFLRSPAAISFFVYLQTGRVVRSPQSVVTPAPDAPAPTLPQQSAPTLPPAQPEEKPVFSPGDLDSLVITYGCSYRPELEDLLLSPLNWDLTEDKPTVLIVHTHATESYEKEAGENYEENAPYRTLEEAYNMVSIGDEVARVLAQGGITVLHDRSYHDYPSYNGSYGNARVSIEEYLRRYPSIQMVLDIHRDAIDGADGNQLDTHGTVDGQESAQLMVVVGTDATGNYHPTWQKNLALALKLTAVLERADPGLTRPINLRAERFNMDLTPGSLLIEVGGAGNTHQEAILAANALARGILALARGS